MYIVIFITCPNKKEASRIAKALIKNKLAACVNIIENIKSIFWWQGKVDCSGEVLLTIKSKKTKLAAIIKRVESMHSYEVVEVIALPIIGGNKKYLEWINDSLR